MAGTSDQSQPFPDYLSLDPSDLIDPQDQYFWHAAERGREALYRQAYIELCEPVTGKKPADTPPDEEVFTEQVRAYLERNREGLSETICARFRYCEKMKKYGYFAIPVPLLLTLTGLLLDVLAAGGMASTCWMTTKGLLDKFCNC